jgi:hypothetical protein
MADFLSAHGYAPGPTQRPLLAGAVSGLIATIPAIGLLQLFGTLPVEAAILRLSIFETLAAGSALMGVAGAIYARVYGRAANDARGGWLSGMAYGFALWAAGAVMVLPIASGGLAPAGDAALGAFLSLVVWGGALGTLLPFVQRRLHQDLETAAKRDGTGPDAAAG